MSLQTAYLSNHCEGYDGSQLKPGWIYLQHGLLGSAVVAWIGPCQVNWQNMVDLFDLREKKPIRARKMLHIVGEFFAWEPKSLLFFQRLVVMGLQHRLEQLTTQKFIRSGDDLYWENRKLNVSIVSHGMKSSLLHLGINVTNDDTPVPTCSLSDFKLSAEDMALWLLQFISQEFKGVEEAFFKIREF